LKESYLPSFMDDAWSWAWSLKTERPVLAPAALIYQGFLSRKKRHFLHSKSVGLAAGNTMEEAVIHGINEWLESEALNSLPKPLPFSRLDSIPALEMSTAHCLPPELKKAGAFIFCFYIQPFRDVRIHSFLPSIFMDDGDGSYTIISGLACNLDPSNALKRAVSELMEICLRRGVDMFSHPGVMKRSGAYKPRTALSLERLRNYSTGSIHRDYLEYRKMLDKEGLELIVKDMTRPELGIPVARVLVPGMKLTLLADSLTFTPDSLGFFESAAH
ncbi:MAG: YcaO-like family protein, partial [Elusimicrobia bacterium]|nr:YcaO-like family protein [Elusimicrobiota bacterium]